MCMRDTFRVVTCLALALACLACESADERMKKFEESRRERVEKELRKLYKFDLSSVSATLHRPGKLRKIFSTGHLEITNISKRNWSQIEVVLNPPDPGDSIWDAVKFEFNTSGFRAPKETDKVFARLRAGQSLEIPLDEFSHTDSREIFSLDSYTVSRIYIRAAVEYQGFKIPFDGTFSF